MVYVSRDCFSRTELHRSQEAVKKGETCSWCGGGNRRSVLYRYRNESDGGRKYEISGRFCSVSCMRSYHS